MSAALAKETEARRLAAQLHLRQPLVFRASHLDVNTESGIAHRDSTRGDYVFVGLQERDIKLLEAFVRRKAHFRDDAWSVVVRKAIESLKTYASTNSGEVRRSVLLSDVVRRLYDEEQTCDEAALGPGPASAPDAVKGLAAVPFENETNKDLPSPAEIEAALSRADEMLVRFTEEVKTDTAAFSSAASKQLDDVRVLLKEIRTRESVHAGKD